MEFKDAPEGKTAGISLELEGQIFEKKTSVRAVYGAVLPGNIVQIRDLYTRVAEDTLSPEKSPDPEVKLLPVGRSYGSIKALGKKELLFMIYPAVIKGVKGRTAVLDGAQRDTTSSFL